MKKCILLFHFKKPVDRIRIEQKRVLRNIRNFFIAADNPDNQYT